RGREDPERVGEPVERAVPDREDDEHECGRDPEQRVALDEPAAADELDDEGEEEQGDDHRDPLGPDPEALSEDRQHVAHAGPPLSALVSTVPNAPVDGGGDPSNASGRRRSSPTNRASMTLTM